MGRKKSYQRDDLIERAMGLFWRLGYEGTSITALTEQLNVNKFGLYAEFGSKQGLYEVTLQRYDDIVVSRHFGRLETPTSGLDDIAAGFHFFATAPENTPIPLGCMLCNAATERAALDTMTAGHVARYMERMTNAHRNALANAERDGQLRSGTDIQAQSALFVTQLLGLFVLRRSQADLYMLQLAGEAAHRQIDALRITPKRS